ncbi:MAG: MarR family winged helix-turn-helix transcriptional regulator [Acidimicrobiales bacterium]
MSDTESNDGPIDLGALPSYLGYQLRQAQAAVFRDFARIMAEVGVSPGQFSLLTLVEANPGISQTTLALTYGLDKSTLSYSVNELVKRDLIHRTRRNSDRRFYGLELTDGGSATLRRATAVVETQERRMDAALEPGERGQLLALLTRVAGALER